MRPRLLLLPGMLNTHRVFDGAVTQFALQADVRVADLTRQSDMTSMAADAWDLLDDAPAEQPLVLVGYSMGGYVALQMLADARRPVHGLGLISSSARPDTPEAGVQRARAIAAIERDFERYLWSLLGFTLSVQSRQNESLVAAVRADMRAVGAQAAVSQHRAAATRVDQRPRLPTLQMPVQVLCGSADSVTPLAASQEMAAAVARGQLDVVQGAGHLLPFEHPGRVASMLTALVQRATTS